MKPEETSELARECFEWHEDYHIPILVSPLGCCEALICTRCKWVFQKQLDNTWQVRQTL